MKDPWKRFKVNTPDQRLEYLANWFRGNAKRYGVEKAKLKLEEHPEKETIRNFMKRKTK